MTIQLIVDSQNEANQVLEAADQLIKKYDYLSVSDLYEMTGNLGTFNDTKIGWTDLEKVVTDRTTDGLSTSITFPAPLPLNI
jgi:hypothetical protein